MEREGKKLLIQSVMKAWEGLRRAGSCHFFFSYQDYSTCKNLSFPWFGLSNLLSFRMLISLYEKARKSAHDNVQDQFPSSNTSCYLSASHRPPASIQNWSYPRTEGGRFSVALFLCLWISWASNKVRLFISNHPLK